MSRPEDDLLSDLPRGAPPRPQSDFTPPDSTFTATDVIRRTENLTYGKGRLFLGLIDGSVERDDKERPGDRKGNRFVMGGHAIGIEDDRHIVTIAGSRAGKGRAAIVPNMLLYPGSVLATDPKGELATMTARRRREMGQAVHVLDPFNVTAGAAMPLRAGFNPIAAMRPDSLVEDAALIADALVEVKPDSHDPHWDESARAFIEGVTLHVATAAGLQGKSSLVTVQQLIARGAKGPDGQYSMLALETLMRSNPAADGVVQTAAADFFDRSERERQSVLSTARRHLKFLDYPGIRSVVRRHDFELETLKTEPTTIYLCLPARHMGTCSRWLRLFVNLMLQAMERTPGRPKAGVPVLCCLDEFAALGHMSQIEDAAGQIAGFGVRLWPILQDLGQLQALYKDRWETFLGNAGIVQFFGNADLTTLGWISRRCGKTSIKTLRKSDVTEQQGRAGAKGESTAIEIHDLLTVDEAARFFGRADPKLRQLVVWAGAPQPLLVLQRAYYDKHGLFAGLADDPAGPV